MLWHYYLSKIFIGLVCTAETWIIPIEDRLKKHGKTTIKGVFRKGFKDEITNNLQAII